MTEIDESATGSASGAAGESSAVTTPTRRSLLAGGLGALAGLAASALGRPQEARATNGQPILLGAEAVAPIDGTGTNEAANTTKIVTTGGVGFWAEGPSGGLIGSAGASYGVRGQSQSSNGVWGNSNSAAGVFGSSSSAPGVYGGSSLSAGVRGFSNGSYGVHGQSNESDGVRGTSTATNGIGVYGEGPAANGTGVAGTGRVGVFATSNVAGWMGIWGRHFGAGFGVAGDSVSHIGVSGVSDATNQPGMLARSRGNSAGIIGFSGGTSSTVPSARAKTGVFGQASQDSNSRGVLGKSTTGNGVRGEASSGVAMYGAASSIGGYAFRGSGRVRFDKVSGVASIPAGSTSVTVTPGVDVTADSFVLLTAKANIGTRSLYFTTDTTNNRITIRMSSSRTSATSIGWLLLR